MNTDNRSKTVTTAHIPTSSVSSETKQVTETNSGGPDSRDPPVHKMLSMKEVVHVTGLPRARIYRLLTEDAFPKPMPIAPRRIGWVEHDIERWIAQETSSRQTLLPLKEVVSRTLQTRADIRQGVEAGSFPKPFKLQGQSMMWAEQDIDRWIAALPRVTDIPVRKASPPRIWH